MKAETRFPRTVEAYKAHLHEDRPHYDSFQTFCRKQGVGYKGVMQWMHRHNRSIGSLRLEVLLEKNGNDSNLKSSLIEVAKLSDQELLHILTQYSFGPIYQRCDPLFP